MTEVTAGPRPGEKVSAGSGWATHASPLLRHALGWAPMVVATVICSSILIAFGTPVTAIALYALYLTVFAAVPGTLVWRMLRPGSHGFLEDVVAGTVLALAVQALLTYILAPWGLARAASLWVVAIVVLCIARPRSRTFWHSAARRRTPPWMSWTLAVVSVLAVWSVAVRDFRVNPIAPIPGLPGQYFPRAPYADAMFHQAVSGSALRGAATYPQNLSSHITYQMMVYEHLADVHRWTGVDLTLLVMRLHTVPLMVLAIVLCGVIAYRLTGQGAVGGLGAVLGYMTTPPALYHDSVSPFRTIGGLLGAGLYRSPTQAFGQPLFILAVLLIVVLLTRARLSWRLTAALALVMFVAGGAKATFLPTLICALAAVLVVGWCARAGKTTHVVPLAGLCVAAFAASLVVFYGTNTQGLELDFGRQMLSHVTPVARALGDPGILSRRIVGLVLIAGAWLVGVIGAVAALITRPRDLRAWLLFGVGAAASGATMLAAHPGQSQMYFIIGGWPVFGTLAAVGIGDLVRKVKMRSLTWIAAAAAMATGLVVSLLLRRRFEIPTGFQGWRSYLGLGAPFIVLAALALAIALLVGAVDVACGRRLADAGNDARVPRRFVALVPLIAVAVVQGAAFSDAVARNAGQITQSGVLPTSTAPKNFEGVPIPPDGAYIAREVRRVSGPNDVIATNMHCRSGIPVPQGGICDARHFWLAALSERQVLLEGWAYSFPPSGVVLPEGNTVNDWFWDQDLLERNDAAISEPSDAGMEWLREKGVDWIVVDRSRLPGSSDLSRYAKQVLERGEFAAYRLG